MKIDRRKIHHWLRVAQQLQTWQLIVILVLMVFVSATLLRLNNLGMIERRSAVMTADKSGDPQQIETALSELQQYVTNHMNTDLGRGVYLVESYNRDSAKVLQQANDAANPNSAVYQQASVTCRDRFQGGVESFRNDYVQCVLAEVNALSSGADPAGGIGLPKAELYRYDFVSPTWSFDLAGISVLLTTLLLVMIVLKIAFSLIAQSILKRRSKHFYS